MLLVRLVDTALTDEMLTSLFLWRACSCRVFSIIVPSVRNSAIERGGLRIRPAKSSSFIPRIRCRKFFPSAMFESARQNGRDMSSMYMATALVFPLVSHLNSGLCIFFAVRVWVFSKELPSKVVPRQQGRFVVLEPCTCRILQCHIDVMKFPGFVSTIQSGDVFKNCQASPRNPQKYCRGRPLVFGASP